MKTNINNSFTVAFINKLQNKLCLNRLKSGTTGWCIKSGPFHFVAYNVYNTHILENSITYPQYLNSTMRLISGTLRSTPLPWLPVLSNIELPALRRKAATDKLVEKIVKHDSWPIQPDILIIIIVVYCDSVKALIDFMT